MLIKPLRDKYGPIIFLLIVSLAMFIMVLATHRSFYASSDNLYQAYPWYQKMSQVIHSGQLPLWNANTFGGQSFAGDFQVGVFYPLNILMIATFGTKSGINTAYLEALVVIHFFIAAVGTYLLAKAWGLGRVASLGSALTYSLAGVVLARASQQTCIFFGLALIPLGVYGFVRYFEKKRLRWLALSGFTFGNIILAGHIQPYIHGLLILGIYWLVLAVRQRKTDSPVWLTGLAGMAIIVAVSIIVSLPQLYLSLQYLPHALRWLYEGYKALNQQDSYNTFARVLILRPENIANFLNPTWSPVIDANTLFLGLPVLVLLLVGLLQTNIYAVVRQGKELKWFILSLCLFGALAAVGYYSFVAKFIYLTPILSQVRELARYVILIQFGLTILVGLTIQAIVKARPDSLHASTKQYLFVAGGVLSLTGLYYSRHPRQLFGVYFGLDVLLAGLFCLVLASFWGNPKLGRVVVVVMVLSGALNFLMMVPMSVPATGAKAYYADTPVVHFLSSQPYGSYRTMILDEAIPVNIADVYKFQTIGGYGATVYQPYAEFLHQNRQNLRITPDYHSAQLDQLGVKYVVATTKLDLPVAFSDKASGITVYQRNHYLPKLFLPAVLQNSAQPGGVNFTIVSYTDEAQTYQIHNYKGGSLMLTEIYYPGWKAYVDGSRVTLSGAIGTSAGLLDEVSVPAGSHSLTLKYQPF